MGNKLLKFTFKPYPTILIENMDMHCNFLFMHIYKDAMHKSDTQLKSPVSVSLKNLASDCGMSNTTLKLTLQALIDANLIKVELGKSKKDKTRIWINYSTIEEYSSSNTMPFVSKYERGTTTALDNNTTPTVEIEQPMETTETKPKRRERPVKTFTYIPTTEEDEPTDFTTDSWMDKYIPVSINQGLDFLN